MGKSFKKTRKILSLILATLMAFGVVQTTAFAKDTEAVTAADNTTDTTAPLEEEEIVEHAKPENVSDNTLDPTGQCGENVYWTFDEASGALTISGTGAMDNYEVCSSPFYNNKNIKTVVIENGVTMIGWCAFECCGLSSVTFGNDVTYIGDEAFTGCESLTSIDIPDSITNIGEYAFSACTNLMSVIIGKGLSSISNIDDSVFAGCTKLKSITVDENNEKLSSDSNGILYNKNKTKLIQYPIGNEKTSFTIPDSVTSIGEGAFAWCRNLTSIVIPASVTSIGGYAFLECDNLTIRCYQDSYAHWYARGKNIPYELIDGEDPGDDPELATTGQCGNNVYWTFDEETGALTISGTGNMWNYDEDFADNDAIKSVTIESGVTSIGGYAFADCSSLTSIEIPDSVTSIGYGAFYECSSLTSIEIPDSVTSIGDEAFYWCSSLTSITVDSNNAYYSSDTSGVLYNKDKTELIQYPIGNTRTSFTIPDSVASIGYEAFYYCKSLTSVTIGNSVTSIGDNTFFGCPLENVVMGNGLTWIPSSLINKETLKTFVIGNSVTSIDWYAFSGCSSLTSVTIGNNLTSIGTGAFNDCSSLTSIEIPDSVTSVGWYAFYDCSSLTSIEIPDSVTSIGDWAFYGCPLENVVMGNGLTSIPSALIIKETLKTFVIGNSVTSIGDYAFDGCTSLTSIEIPDSVTSIGNWAFSFCSSLTSIDIPDSVTSIGGYAFEYCSSLTSIEIPDSVTSIGGGAFRECSSLTSIEIPDSVTSIGDGAFSDCTGLTSVTIGNNVMSIGHGAFDYCSSLATIDIPDSVTSIGSNAFYGCESLTRITVGENNENYSSDSFGVLYNKDKTELIQYPTGNERTSFAMPESVICIDGWGAFSGCESLKTVTIGKSVTSIGEVAFDGCSSLTSIEIPDSVTSIGGHAFSGCSSLTSIEIPDSVTSIGSEAFYNTGYYNNSSNWENGVLYIGNYLIKAKDSISGSYKIKQGTKCIANWAFEGCSSLTSITIPDSVTSIGEGAFGYCSSLTSIEIHDSVIRIGQSAFYDTGYYNDEANWEDGLLYISKFLIASNNNYGERKEFVVKDGTKSIADVVFGYLDDYTVTIPKSVTSIGVWRYLGHKYNYNTTIKCYKNSYAYQYALKETMSIELIDGDTTLAPTGMCGDSVYWTFDEATGLLTIRGAGDMWDRGDYSSGLSAFYNDENIKTVVIEDGVTSIGDEAFFRCESLTSIEIPNSVTSIGEYAFTRCSSLTSITIGDGITSIGGDAFSFTGYYNDEANWEDGVIYIGKNLIDAKYNISGEYKIKDGTKCIAEKAFDSCSSLTGIEIPDSVTSIGNYAFLSCMNLTSIEIPDDVTSIGEGAFAGCRSLTSVEIPDSVTSISDFAFTGCDSLTSVTIGNGVTSIGSYAFHGCTNLTIIAIPDRVTSIGDQAFYDYITILCYKNSYAHQYAIDNGIQFEFIDGDDIEGQCGDNVYWTLNKLTGVLTINGTGDMWDYDWNNNNSPFKNKISIKSIKIESGVTSIGEDAFIECCSLTSVEIPDSVTRIGSNAFANCSSLISIEIPNSVTIIGYGAFAYCIRLTSVTIGNGVTSIGNSAFYCCRSLTSVTIGNGVTSIGDWAFLECDSLANVTIGNSVTSIGDLAFQGCRSLTSIEIPDSVTSIGGSAFSYCSSLTSITVDSNNEYYCSDEFGVLYNKNKTELIQYPIGNTRTSFTIPDSVTSTGYYAFAGCTSLTTVTIGNGVTSIGDGAFDGCDNLTIRCYQDSYAHQYAIDNEIAFELITAGHVHTPITVTIPATCSQAGASYQICETCGETLSEITVIPTIPHTEGEWTVTVPATCTTEGTKEKRCTVCSALLETDTVPATGHTPVKDEAVAPTCTETGLTEGSHCSVCNTVLVAQETVNAAGHTEGAWTVTVPATCTTEGAKEKRCTVCTALLATDTVPATGHTPKTVTIPATCTQAGASYQVCETCGETISEITVLPITAHTFGEWTTTKEPTIIEEGKKERACTVCGAKETKTLPKIETTTVTNTGTGVGLAFPEGAYEGDVSLEVTKVYDGAAFQIVNTLSGVSEIFDITTKSNGVTVQPNGEVLIKIPLPQGFDTSRTFVYHVDVQTGRPEKMTSWIEGDFIVFITNHFSYFALVQEEPQANVKGVSIGDVNLQYKSSANLKPQITADNGASYTVTYSSSNPSVVSVDNSGKVTSQKQSGFSRGSAIITVTVKDSNGHTVQDTCKVTVSFAWWQWLIKIMLFGFIWY